MDRAADTIGELMRRDVITVEAERPVRAAIAIMVDHDIGSLVVTEGELAVGLFTERDLLRRIVGDEGLLARTVREVMSSPLVTVSPSAIVQAAFDLMTAHGIRRLPVVAGGDVVGIVTERDLLGWVSQVGHDDA